MWRRGALLVVTLGLVAMPTLAQNVLPNPDFDSDASYWTRLQGSGDWNDIDTRGCAGSGSLSVDCGDGNGAAIGSTACLQLALAPTTTIFLQADLAPSQYLCADVTMTVKFYTDAICGNLAATSTTSVASTCFSSTTHFSWSLASPAVTVGSITATRVQVDTVGDCPLDPNFGFPAFLQFDALYLGKADRVVTHDFENAAYCPLTGSS